MGDILNACGGRVPVTTSPAVPLAEPSDDDLRMRGNVLSGGVSVGLWVTY